MSVDFSAQIAAKPSQGGGISENERVVLELLRCKPGMTRADITRSTGLTAQSISRLVEALETRGVIEIGARKTNGRGQPSHEVFLKPDAAYGLGMSIMTDAVSASLMNLSGAIIATEERALPDPSWTSVLDTIVSLHDDILSEHLTDRRRLAGLGVAVTGAFIGEGLQVNPPEPLDELAFIDIDEMIAARLNLPVWLDNDGSAAAIGEAISGVGRSLNTFGYIFFAMGVGGGVVIDGKLHRGAVGNAGEFAGVLPEAAQDERPTMELLRRILAEHGVELRDIKELVDLFDPEWPGVDEYIAMTGPHLNAMVSAISAVLDPQAIILGGRMPRALAERFARELHFFNVPRRSRIKPVPKILPGEVQGDAAAIGAAAMPLKALYFR